MSEMDNDVDLSGWAEDGPNGAVILRLAYPFELRTRDGRGPEEVAEVDQLVFNRPKAGHLDHIASSAKGMRKFMSLLIADKRITEDKLARDLDVDDFFRAAAVAAGFLPKKKTDSTAGDSPET